MSIMILGYIVFLLIMIALLWINKVLRKTFFTVSNYLIATFSVITGVQVVACLLLKYKPATVEYWLILTIFIVIASLTDLAASRFAKKITFNGVKLKKCNPARISIKRNEKKFDILCMISAFYSILHFIILSGGFSNIHYIVQEEFQNQYGSGLNFYVRLLMLIATSYYWGCAKISKKNLILGLICLIPNVLTFVKGMVFIPCLAAIILRLKKGDIKISLKAGIIIILTGICVFFGVYLVEMGVYNPEIIFEADTYKEIGSNLISYLISGVQSFSQNISENNISNFRKVDNITLAPFINSFAKIGVGESIDPLCTIWQKFGYSAIRGGTVESNVNTYIGTLYLYNGVIVGCLLNVFWVFIASFLDEISAEKYDIITALSSLFCAAFALGWFEYYFMQTFWLYLIGIAFLLKIIFKIKLYIRR